MNLKLILSFLAGGAVGSLITYLVVDKKKDTYYQECYERDVKKMEEYYEYKYTHKDEEGTKEEITEKKEPSNEEQNITVTSSNTVSSATAYKNEPKSRVDYSSYYDESDSDEEDNYEEEDEDARYEREAEERLKNRDKPPRIISSEAAADVPAYYDFQLLTYYEGNDILTDEEDSVIDCPELLVGDALTKYDFKNSKEQEIFVINYSMDVLYQISRKSGCFLDV